MRLSKYRKRDYYDSESPSSSGYGSNYLQYSPSWSGGFSPYSSPSRSNNEDDFDSDTYSPVYSDAEEPHENQSEQEDPKEPLKQFDILSLLYDNGPSKSNVEKLDELEELMDLDENSHLTSEFDENAGDKPSRSKSDQTDTSECVKMSNQFTEAIAKDPLPCILTLLWKISIQCNNAADFVRIQNLNTLLQVCYVVKQPNGRIYQILENILQ